MKTGTLAALIGAALCGLFTAVPTTFADQVRKPVVAGQFYSAHAAQLRAELKNYLDQAPQKQISGEIVGISVPHAGYIYSAQTAAAAYKAVMGNSYDIIVILAPSHRDYFTGASIYTGDAYETPLGQSTVDHESALQLSRASDLFKLSLLGHQQEHSLEVQLPFIQYLFPKARVLPIIIGEYDWKSCETMGKALAKVLQGRRALLVASTDLYHGYSYQECQKSDAATLAAFGRMEPRALCEGLLNEKYKACGGAPVVILQVAAAERGRCVGEIISRTNSNDVTGEKGGYVVGYGAAAYYLQEKAMNKQTFSPLGKDAQIELINMAMESIKYYLKHNKIPSFNSDTPVLQEKRGVFVTITKDGALRGCIGMHEADIPLYKLVPDRAVAAAFDDPRFMPLRLDELDKIKIKISVYLTNVYKAESLDEFVMGKHGIILVKGNRGATYLPEVPLEAGWKSKEEEMASLCQKAGLPPGSWREGAQIFLYETQVFDESVLKH